MVNGNDNLINVSSIDSGILLKMNRYIGVTRIFGITGVLFVFIGIL